MLTITLDNTLENRLRLAAAARGEDPNAYATAMLQAAIENEISREAQELLNGPARRFDPGAIRAKHGLSDQTPEQISSDADAALASLDDREIAEMKRQGLL